MSKPSLPSPDQAFDKIATDVHANVFFTKLAQRGYQPRSQEEAFELLKLAADLRTAAEDPRIKAAFDRSNPNPYAVARESLHGYLRQTGLDGPFKSAGETEANLSIMNYAAQLATDGDIYNSVLTIKAAEASAVAQRIGYVPAAAV